MQLIRTPDTYYEFKMLPFYTSEVVKRKNVGKYDKLNYKSYYEEQITLMVIIP